MKKTDSQSLASSAAVWSAIFMFVLWILARMGLYVSAAEQMAQWHMFFDLTPTGLLGGAIEAAIVSYIMVASFIAVHKKMKK